MSKVDDFIFQYGKIKEILIETPEKKKEIQTYIDEMAANYKEESIRVMETFLDLTLMRLYEGIDVDIPPDLDLLQLTKDNQVIFVPNHQSHADYLVFNYLMHKRFGIRPYIAGGVNLNIFLIGSLFRSAGCFFIRRTISNRLYKTTLEAYIAYIFEEGYPIEFFYEGGRTRTGKLMPPKYGLFQMILQIHENRIAENKKTLLFVPVSIVHEVVPEHQTLVKEMGGAKKKSENFGQVMGLYKFLSRKFGVVHVKIGHPISGNIKMEGTEEGEGKDFKKTVQDLAIECYRSVGKGMSVTPYALLSLVLLDSESGSLTFEDIHKRAEAIVNYARRFNIPLPESLRSGLSADVVEKALSLFIDGKKIKVVHNRRLAQHYYVIEKEARLDVLFSKNMILHHFIVPFLVNLAWFNIFNGRLKNGEELKKYLLEQRDKLKHEFYLPTTKDLFIQSVELVQECTGRTIKTLDDCFMFTPAELYSVAKVVSPFSNAFRYIYECYYMTIETLLFLSNEQFDEERFFKVGREIFELERNHGRFVKHEESFTLPGVKNALMFLIHKGLVLEDKKVGSMHIPDLKLLSELKVQYAKDLTEILRLNFEFFSC